MYNDSKKNTAFFSRECWARVGFSVSFYPSPTPFIALVTVNKLQENYFSIGAQCFPYLMVTAVTYTDALI